MDEVVKEQISPVEVGKKWSVNSDTIRAWIRKAGLTLPKIYKKMNPGYELFSINTVLIQNLKLFGVLLPIINPHYLSLHQLLCRAELTQSLLLSF